MHRISRFLVATALWAVPCAAAAVAVQDWPQFRGPTGQGHAAGGPYPTTWSEDRNVVWKVPVQGRGWSSPVVAGGRVWLTTAVSERSDVSLRLMAYDVATGQQTLDTEVFKLRGAALLNAKNSHASPTPVIEGDRVYVHFGSEGTAALSTDGAILWKARHRYQSQHGGGGSPVIYRQFLIVNCDGADDAYVVAMDKDTGKVRWRTWRRKPWSQAYSTPVVIEAAGGDQLVSVGAFYAAAYDPATGKEIWHVSYPDGFSNVPRPVHGQGLVFITTGFQQPSLIAVRPDGKGNVTRSHVAWTLQRGVPHTPSPLLVDRELYMVSDGGIMTSVDATTGAVRWQHRLPGAFSASPIFAGGRIYLTSEEGLTTVVEPAPEFRATSSNAVPGATLASIAAADGSLFLRAGSHLYRIADQAAAR